MKRAVYIIFLLCLIFVLITGCTKDTDVSEGYVYVTIDATKADKGIILSEYAVSLKEGTTVFDITFAACKDNGILMSSRGTVVTRYIEGIADLYEFDLGPASGWVYYVNDISATIGCGLYEIKEGDKIRWEYIIE
ncbi:MAG TPA: DUF4430 domain-containing protein [Clostridia bacterium]|jgi:hypothetical protein|nr:DUF4430 domain-containing protein [Clostridia bacterium]HPY98454.1 DUF4430 domain-containing protein [Clostridia bacterium]HQC68332.1 DUF4430 domain-containing protein [Clostridia bacterium]